MSDLRDQTHKPAQTADDLVFLDYHEQSPWAKAKVSAGLRLTPEALAYMQNEIDARGLRKKLYDEQLEKEKAETTNGAAKNNQERKSDVSAPVTDGGSKSAADDSCGSASDTAQNI